MNNESTVMVMTEDHNTIPYKNLELALKSEFQFIIISKLSALQFCKDITSDHLLFVNRSETVPKSELNRRGWTATWKMRDDGPFNIHKFRLDWGFYSPDGIRRNLDISRYSGRINIYEAIKELTVLSQFPDWKSCDLHTENLKLKGEVERLKEENTVLENQINSIKQLLS